MFNTRYRFHKDIYNHKTVKIIELMIGDALVNANSKYNFYENITLKNKCGQLIGNFNPDTKIGSIIGNAEITYKNEYKNNMGPYNSSGWFSCCQLGRRNQNRSGAV